MDGKGSHKNLPRELGREPWTHPSQFSGCALLGCSASSELLEAVTLGDSDLEFRSEDLAEPAPWESPSISVKLLGKSGSEFTPVTKA